MFLELQPLFISETIGRTLLTFIKDNNQFKEVNRMDSHLYNFINNLDTEQKPISIIQYGNKNIYSAVKNVDKELPFDILQELYTTNKFTLSAAEIETITDKYLHSMDDQEQEDSKPPTVPDETVQNQQSNNPASKPTKYSLPTIQEKDSQTYLTPEEQLNQIYQQKLIDQNKK